MTFEQRLHDAPDAQAFSVDRSIFTDEALFEREMRLIFERTWNFVGLESQLPEAHSFFTTYIGRQPVLVMRDETGQIGCFLNSCRHRGTLLCPLKKGRQRLHVCRYHAWSYDTSGRNVQVTDAEAGLYPPGFHDGGHDLIRAARLESYRGLLFASLSDDVPPLAEYLGDARTFIDLVADQSPVGQLEFVPGEIRYTFDANWKLQFENGLDFYHFRPTHSAYIDVIMRRGNPGGDFEGLPGADEPEGQGSFSFNHGHAVNWSIRQDSRIGSRALLVDRAAFDEVAGRVGETRIKWMLRQRNLTIFPNLQIIDISSGQLRIWRPLSADKTEMVSYCLAPVGEGPEPRKVRIRSYEEFFSSSGLATSDDNVMYELCQSGYAAAAGPTQGYARGLGSARNAAAAFAEELGVTPVESRYGSIEFGDETNFHAGYREWRRLLSKESG